MQPPATTSLVPADPTSPVGTATATATVTTVAATATAAAAVWRSTCGELSLIGGSRIGGGAPSLATEALCIRAQAQPQRGARGGSIGIRGGSIRARGCSRGARGGSREAAGV